MVRVRVIGTATLLDTAKIRVRENTTNSNSHRTIKSNTLNATLPHCRPCLRGFQPILGEGEVWGMNAGLNV